MSAHPLSLPRIFSCAAIGLLGLAHATTASARAAGISGYTGKTAGMICNNCHNGGTAPTVLLTGPATLTTGQVAEYKLRVETAAAVTGMAASTSEGVLSLPAATNLKLLNGEVTHQAPVVPTAGASEFTFSVTAPAVAGAITIYAAGNAGNQNNATSGDLAAVTTLQVQVTAAVVPTDAGTTPAPTTPTGDADPDAGSGATGPASTDPGATGAASGDGGNVPFYLRGTDDGMDPQFAETGCSLTSARAPRVDAGSFAIFGLALGALIGIRRRGKRA